MCCTCLTCTGLKLAPNGKSPLVINGVDLAQISQWVRHCASSPRGFFPSILSGKHQHTPTKLIPCGVITATAGNESARPAVKCRRLTNPDIKAGRLGCSKVVLEDSGRL